MRDSGCTVRLFGADFAILVADVSTHGAVWPLRVALDPRETPCYVVWRDVFEGKMRCSLAEAIATHKQALFGCCSHAVEYAEWRNRSGNT